MTGTVSHYFDGDRATPHEVHLILSSDQSHIRMERDGHDTITWPVLEVRRVSDQAGKDQTILRWTEDPLARLVLNDRTLLFAFPRLDRRAPPKGRSRLVGWALAAVAAVAIQIFVLVPMMADQLARFIPPEGERALGEATLAQIQSALDRTGQKPIPFCENEDGLAALRKMETRLTERMDLDQPLSVHVLDHEMANAFALPGGYVTFFRGLLKEAETPEQVAAVFAHEIGHVASRDPTRHALRSAGSIGILGLLFGDFAGGAVVLFMTERLIDAQYSQEAESLSDEFATKALIAADISPAALGEFFDISRRKRGDTRGIRSHYSSHPALGDRIKAAKDAVPENQKIRPLLTETEWQALQNICD